MAAKGWFSNALRQDVKAAVQAVEQQTSAEIVVAVQPASGRYRAVDMGVGGVLALGVLCVFLYHPAPFDFTFLPLELLVVFALGVMLSVALPPLRRALVRRRLMAESVERAARAAFVELRIHTTRERTGILVFVSHFERTAAIVPDVGVAAADPGEGFRAACEHISSAARRRDSAAFTQALRELGPALSAPLPRRDDDENELPDDVAEVES